MGCADCAILRASLEFASWSEAYGRSERSGARDTQGGYLEQLASRCPWAQEVVRTLKVGLDTKLSTVSERESHAAVSACWIRNVPTTSSCLFCAEARRL
eukprot:767323-Hanusia_phi.AAC.2